MKLVQIPDFFANLPIIRNYTAKANSSNMPLKKDAATIQIIQEYAATNQKDNKDWQDVLRAASDPENPTWDGLQDLYDKLIVDAHTHSLMDLRENATLSTRHYITDDKGEEQPEKTAFFQTEWFYNFLSEVLKSIARGYTVGQLINPQTMKFFFVPRRNYVPQKNMVKLKVSDQAGILLDQPALADVMIVVKNNYKYGYMNDLVPLILWKLNTLMSWAEATEKYGLPPLIATTKSRDQKTINALNEMLKGAAETLTAVLPEGTTVAPMANYDKIDPEKMFGGLMKVCDEGIAKRIVGGTMIVDNGSSRSQSEVHNGNFEGKIIESDKRICEFVVNGQLIPMMIRNGWALADTDKWQFDRSQKLTLKEQWEITAGALAFYEMDEEKIKKTFNLPIIGKKVTAATPPTNFNQPTKALALALVGKGITLPNYQSQCSHVITRHEAIYPVAAGFDQILSDLSDELINNVFKGKNTLVNEVLKAIATFNHLNEGLRTGWEGVKELSYDSPDVQALAMMEYNLFEFSRMKSNANVIALNQLLKTDDGKGIRTFDDFKSKALPYLNNSDVAWLRTEYNHSIAVGQQASRYYQFKNEVRTVTKWVQYKTVGDSHVRPAHQILNDKVFNLEDPSGLSIWPPNGWGCRCEMVQYLGKPTDDLKISNKEGLNLLGIKEDSSWAVNRGDIKQVFTANEMYAKKLNFDTDLKKMPFSNYGLKPYTEIKDNYKSLVLDKTITPDNVQELFTKEKGKDFKGYTDYLGRKVVLTEKRFTEHLQGDYKNDRYNRHQLFPHINDVLNQPDEVYLFEYAKGKFQTRYIKFYNNDVLVVNTNTGSELVEINTWFKNEAKDAAYRNGYLIHTKKP